MKTTSFLASKNRFYSVLAFFLCLSVILPSCSKDDDDDLSLSANVMIVNSVEGSQAQDLYFNDAKINTQAVAYSQNSGYITASPGDKNVQFKNAGSTTVTSSSSASLESGKYYTFYFTGNGSATAKTEDDMSAPPAGKAKVRYINLNASGSSSVDFSLNGTNLTSGIAYQSASAFSTVDAGLQTFKIYLTGTSNLAFELPVTLQAGKIYTIWTSGSTALSSHVIVMN